MASIPKIVGRTDPTQPHSTREQEIRNRAYEIYLQRGGLPGYELEDWPQAERELTS